MDPTLLVDSNDLSSLAKGVVSHKETPIMESIKPEGEGHNRIGPDVYVMVEFKGRRREIFNNPRNLQVSGGDWVIVEADRGFDAGVVKRTLLPLSKGDMMPQFSLVRVATPEDRERIMRNRQKEGKALEVAKRKVANHNLPMHLVDAEIRFDEMKVIFYFTAEGRVDFRQLVRDLASIFRVRIELRQIGVRDAVRYTDGFGVCGRPLCCVTFLDSFRPITTQMARLQRLILNPFKLSGPCNRLKCCLAYEMELYEQGEMLPLTYRAEEWELDENLDQFSD